MQAFASDKVPLREGLILAIHAKVLETSNPDHAGKYREVSVRVGQDTSPYPAKAQEMMKQMVACFPKTEKTDHPLVVGAKLHLDTVIIHPFFDGNGRASRLQFDYVLLKSGHPDFVPKVEDKPAYFQSIRESRATRNDKSFVHYMIKSATASLTNKIKLLDMPKQKESEKEQPQKKKDHDFDVFDWESEKADF